MKKTSDNTYWFAVRTIYDCCCEKNGKNIFEERICVFNAKTEEEAFLKAREEGARYAELSHMIRKEWMVCYWQDGDKLIDGYEVWSELFESKENIDKFINDRYHKYEYK